MMSLFNLFLASKEVKQLQLLPCNPVGCGFGPDQTTGMAKTKPRGM